MTIQQTQYALLRCRFDLAAHELIANSAHTPLPQRSALFKRLLQIAVEITKEVQDAQDEVAILHSLQRILERAGKAVSSPDCFNPLVTSRSPPYQFVVDGSSDDANHSRNRAHGS